MIRIASWLLRTLGSGPSIETLIGDLTEEHRAGKSAAWILAQLLVAIPATFIAEVRAHKLLTVRAVGLALVLLMPLPVAISLLRPWLAAAAEVYLPAHASYMASSYTIVNGVRVEDGVFPMPWAMAVYVPVLQLLAVLVGAGLIGWVIRRTHAPIRTPAVLAAALAWALFAFVRLGAALQFLGHRTPPEGTSFGALPWWHSAVTTLIVMMIGLFLGGLRTQRLNERRVL